MILVRLLLFLSLAAIGAALLMWLIKRDRRYLRGDVADIDAPFGSSAALAMDRFGVPYAAYVDGVEQLRYVPLPENDWIDNDCNGDFW